MISKGTSVGLIAIVCWSFYACFALLAQQLPPFELLMFAFLICAIFLLFVHGATPLPQIPKPLLICAFLGIAINPLCYFLALRFAPAAETNLLHYTWPVLLVLGSFIVLKEPFRWVSLVAVLLGFSGLTLLFIDKSHFTRDALWGYGFSIFSALTWTIFTLSLRHYQVKLKDIFSWISLASSILFLFIHLLFETFQIPTVTELSTILYLGLGAMGLSFVCWDYGMKHGQVSVLAVLSYFIPLSSTLLLIAFGFFEGHWKILFAACTISAAGLLVVKKQTAQ